MTESERNGSSSTTPPGRWYASDGAWYPRHLAPPSTLWVCVDTPTPLSCCPGLAWLGRVYRWDPATAGVNCSRCQPTLDPSVSVSSRPEPPPTLSSDIPRLLLKYDGICVHCSRKVAAGTKAGWDRASRSVVCVRCLEGGDAEVEAEPDTSHIFDPGIAGRSARSEFERRRRQGAPSGARSYLSGAQGEERTGSVLDRFASGLGWALHDRAVPGTSGNIDHIVVVPSGVWVVDSKNHRGGVRRGADASGARLRVRGLDQHELIDGLSWQVDAVRAACADLPTPIRTMLVFPSSRVGFFRRSFELDGTWCCALNGVAKRLSAGRVLSQAQIDVLASRIAGRLPPYG